LANPETSAVEIDSLNQILINIGRPQDTLDESDVVLLLAEAGVYVESKSRVKCKV
jgi:hypothetical protein